MCNFGLLLHHRGVKDVGQNGKHDKADNGLDEAAGHFLDDDNSYDERQDSA